MSCLKNNKNLQEFKLFSKSKETMTLEITQPMVFLVITKCVLTESNVARATRSLWNTRWILWRAQVTREQVLPTSPIHPVRRSKSPSVIHWKSIWDSDSSILSIVVSLVVALIILKNHTLLFTWALFWLGNWRLLSRQILHTYLF